MSLLLADSKLTSAHHAAVVVVFLVMLVAMLLAGWRWREPTRWVVAAYGFACWALSAVYFATYDRLDLASSLPIQACDLLALIAPLSIVLAGRFSRALTYFGGFGLTTQAFFTPVLQSGPDTLRFWVFWGLHTEIVAAAVFVITVDRFRPNARDLRNAVLFWFVYALIMVVVNYYTGWYYGYLGPEVPPSAEGSILKYLGPWPIRPVVMMLLALSIFVVLWLPWAAAARLLGQTGEEPQE